MRALSIRQPWAHAILHFGKRVENRDWESGPAWMVGKAFLLHAAKGCTRDEFIGAAEFMREAHAARPWAGSTILPGLQKLTRGAIVGRAKLATMVRIGYGGHWWRRGDGPCERCSMSRLAAGTMPCSGPDPWAIPGALGLILADVEAIDEPIPFKGALGFFDVPDAALAGRTFTRVP